MLSSNEKKPHMKKIKLGLLSLSLGAASCASLASESTEAPPAIGKLERPDYHQCLDQAKGRLEKGRCMTSEKEWQLEQTKQLYMRLASKLSGPQRQQLEASQAAWSTFLDAENRFAVGLYDTMGGSSDLSVSTNEILWIVQRRQQLQRHLDVME